MLEQLTINDFESLRGQTVGLRFGEQAETAEVAEVRSPETTPPPGHRQPFSITVLSGRADAFWPQGIYVLEHPEHGDLELFMVPLGPQGDRMRYEISFS
jgi:hypothetical protein